MPERTLRLDDACSANVSVLRSNKRIVIVAARCDNASMSKRRIYDDEEALGAGLRTPPRQ